MRIGVPQSGYGAARNIPPMPGVQHVRPWDMHRVAARSQRFFGGRPGTKLLFTFRDPHFPQVDLLHFFNTVARTSTPWVTTYESIIPRWYGGTTSAERARGIDLILSDSCRQLIGFSAAATAIFRDHLDWLGRSADWPAIAAKNTILHPPQPLFPVVERPDGPVRFAFVGGDFYRKGGLECLEALHRLHAAGIRDWRFEIIGRVDRWHDTTAKTTEVDGRRAAELIAAMPEQVTHRSSAPNAEVLALLSRSHYLLFPTFQDTYGYVVLEAMASGCVPVATAVRSLPEVIQHGANGLLIEVPVNPVGDAHQTATSPEEKVRLVSRLEEALHGLLQGDHAHWSLRSAAARSHVREVHDPERHVAALREIYQGALTA
jgi:glycosyltransferase involved in cell wall biosynthesis